MKLHQKRCLQGGVISVLLCALLILPVSAKTEIYIAGNPDMPPFEYYDKNSGTYRGALPLIYQELEEKLNVDLIYLKPGRKNSQKQLAKNRQVEIVSAHRSWDSQFLTQEFPVYSDREEADAVCIGFTENLPPALSSAICQAILSLSAEEKLDFVLNDYAEPRGYVPFFALLVFDSIVCLSGIAFWIRHRRKMKKQCLLDELTSLGNQKKCRLSFENNRASELQRITYMVYLSCDMRLLSEERARNVQTSSAALLRKAVGDDEGGVFRMSEGVFVLLMQCETPQTACRRTDSILQELNQLFSQETERQLSFRAGLYCPIGSENSYDQSLERARQGWQEAEKKCIPFLLMDQKTIRICQRRLWLKKSIPAALYREEFQLYLRFAAEKETEYLLGAKTLCRWQEPQEGLILPDEYRPLFEEKGILPELEFYILKKCCAVLEQWKNSKFSGLWIACEISRQTVESDSFQERFQKTVAQHHFPHKRLFIILNSKGLSDGGKHFEEQIVFLQKSGFSVFRGKIPEKGIKMDTHEYPADLM